MDGVKAKRKPRVKMPLPDPLFYNHLEVCALLAVTPDAWRKQVQRGAAPYPHHKLGSRGYYLKEDVAYFVKEKRWPAGTKFRPRKADPG